MFCWGEFDINENTAIETIESNLFVPMLDNVMALNRKMTLLLLFFFFKRSGQDNVEKMLSPTVNNNNGEEFKSKPFLIVIQK